MKQLNHNQIYTATVYTWIPTIEISSCHSCCNSGNGNGNSSKQSHQLWRQLPPSSGNIMNNFSWHLGHIISRLLLPIILIIML
jgi:hypothetical protein